MAKKLNAKFTAKATLSDGRVFQKGESVPSDIKKEDLEALREMEAIEEIK